MKKILIVMLLLVGCNNLGITQSWQWAKQIGSDYQFYGERANNIFCDGSNIYLVGAYGGSLIFPSDTLNSNGNNDIFISKFDGSGNVIWIRTIGGNFMPPSNLENGYGAFDSTNNWLYVSGSIIGTVNFGNGVSLSTGINNIEDAFLAKYDASGICQWAKLISSPGKDVSYCFVQPDGNILVAGSLANNGFVDTLPINAGGFFARYDSNGNILWAENKFNGPEKSELNISFIGSDIIMTGAFDINNSNIDTSNLVLTGIANGFLARLDSSGSALWVHTFNGPGVNAGSSVLVDINSNIYVSGGFQDSIEFDAVKLYDSGKDIYIAKFNSNGNLIWAEQTFADSSVAAGLEIDSDSEGNCYLTGLFNGNAQFGSFNISSLNPYDMFVANYNSNGTCLGIRNFGYAVGSHLAVDDNDNAIIVGAFFNTVNIGGTNLSALVGQDIFIAKLDEITGIGENRIIDNTLHIYANPSKGSCTIEIPDVLKNSQNLLLQVFDSIGKLVYEKKLGQSDENYLLKLNNSPKGTYNIILSNDEHQFHGKVVFN
jgi:type IX secretion system substrate protein